MKVIKYVLKILVISMLYGSITYGHNINVPNILTLIPDFLNRINISEHLNRSEQTDLTTD